MKWKIILAGLLIAFLCLGTDLAARGHGHVGSRGFGHLGHGGRGAFGFGIPCHGPFGQCFLGHRFFCPGFAFGNGTPFYDSRFCYPGIGFGYYAPFYSYGYDSSPDYGYLTLSHLYFEGYDSQPGQGHSPKVNPKTNCADSWTETRRDDSLGSAIRSAFQIQCANTHAASESNSPQESLD